MVKFTETIKARDLFKKIVYEPIDWGTWSIVVDELQEKNRIKAQNLK